MKMMRIKISINLNTILAAVLICVIPSIVCSQDNIWTKIRTERAAKQLRSTNYQEITSALSRVVSNSKIIPVEDLEYLKALIYDLLDSDISTPDSLKPASTFDMNFPINVRSGSALARISGYNDYRLIFVEDNHLGVFKEWYKNEHLKELKPERELSNPVPKNTSVVNEAQNSTSNPKDVGISKINNKSLVWMIVGGACILLISVGFIWVRKLGKK